MARTVDLRAKKKELEKNESVVPVPPLPTPSIPESEPIVATQPIMEPSATLVSHHSPVHFDEIVSWSGPLRHHQPNMRIVWPFVIAMFVLSVVTYLFQQNFFTSLLFGLIGIVVLIHIRRDIELAEFEVSYRGIRRGQDLITYREVESFWLDYLPEHDIKELSLHLKKKHMPYLKIPLYEEDPVQIRSIMIHFVPEVEHQDSLAEILARKLGI